VKRWILTFDCYGTLIDWEAGIAAAFAMEARHHGWVRRIDGAQLLAAYAECEAAEEAGSYRLYRDVLASSAVCAAAQLGWELPMDRGGFLAASLPHWAPFPDTNAALARLSTRYLLGLLSNVDDDLLAATRRHFPVDWDLVVTAEQVRSYKPSRGHWEEARRRMVIPPGGEWIHVAQSHYHDVTPCVELGIPVLWVNRRGERLEAARPRPTHEVRTLAEAADVLLSGRA
jgi:2-haloalkanoic acid dehalogenase type II